MTDDLTPEQIREKTREHAISRLEEKAFFGIVGSREILKNQALYGAIGVKNAEAAYDEGIYSEPSQQIRRELYAKKREEANQLGTYARPSVSDYDVEKEIIGTIELSKAELSLGDLEKVVKGFAGNLDLEVPEELRDYRATDLLEKQQKKQEITEDEKKASFFYNQLSQIYNKLAAFKILERDFFSDLTGPLKEISEEYKRNREAVK
jgi:hypothetical protein